MLNDKTVVGLDVHAHATQAAVLQFPAGEISFRRINGASSEVVDYLGGLAGSVLATYEAGPVGYALARAAAERGLDVRVCAPGSILRPPHERIKTDRRDAERLARLLLAGELSFVRVPTVEEESYRDLARCREAARGDLMRARHRLGKLLLRRDIRFPGPASNWTQAHWKWLNGLEFDDAPSRAVLTDYLTGVRALEQRRGALNDIIEGASPESPWADTIARLRCMRGINTTTAFGLCAEIGDFHRFKHPTTLCSYLGIIPSEHSSGQQTHRGPITKAGSPHARRLLVEAAHHYRHTPAIGLALARRQDGQDPRACEISWRAQHRLHHQYRRLSIERGKPANIVTVALARELATFTWEIGQLT
ncbi:MAG TPA: IS110 family transposase [Solirubrobacteraceae bacterium]